MVKLKDNDRFERSFAQLKAYYSDTRYVYMCVAVAQSMIDLHACARAYRRPVAVTTTRGSVVCVYECSIGCV